MHVDKKIKILNYMRRSFLQRIEEDSSQPNSEADTTSSNSNSQKLRKIRDHFRSVGDLEKQFQEIIFSNI
jgi:hypothetical protein